MSVVKLQRPPGAELPCTVRVKFVTRRELNWQEAEY